MCTDVWCVTNLVLGIIWAISLPVYIILLITLVKYRKTAFKTSFFKIFVSLGIADVCTMINTYLCIKARSYKLMNSFFLWKPVLIATGSLCWTWQSYFAQLNGVLLLNINRYIALVHPTRYEAIFTPGKTNIFIAVQWILSIIFVIPRPFITFTFIYAADNETLVLDLTLSPVANAWYMKLSIVHCFFLCFITIVMYGKMSVHVYLSGRQVAGSLGRNQSHSSAELRLFGVGFSVAVALFFIGLYFALELFTNMDSITSLLYYSIAFDFFNEMNPYSLILLCTEVRVHLTKFLCCGKQDNRVHSIKSSRKNKSQAQQKKQVAESKM